MTVEQNENLKIAELNVSSRTAVQLLMVPEPGIVVGIEDLGR